MGSKTIALAGVAVSAALIYFCIDLKKDHISIACNLNKEHTKATAEETPVAIAKATETDISAASATGEPAKEETVIFEKSDPAFGIAMGDVFNIVGMFAPDEKDGRLMTYIDQLCDQKECINDIRYSEDIKSVSWDDTMIDMINFFREEHVKGASLYINSNIVHIEGEIDSLQAKSRLDTLVKKLTAEGLRVENGTKSTVNEPSSEKIVKDIEEKIEKVQTIVEEKEKAKAPSVAVVEAEEKKIEQPQTPPTTLQKVKEEQSQKPVEPIEKEIVESVEKVAPKREVEPSAPVVEAASEDTVSSIDQLLQQEIQFDDRMNQVAPQSRKTLDKIAQQLKNGSSVRIAVYAHASDDAMVNTIIAQKRADIIKNYLRQRGVKVAGSTGKGVQAGEEHIEIEIVK
jgi:outer membrane protein OmpA-like peptidoglycan-associated protein